eukprot:278128-Chlamydomonas_euryale.AAC.1
MRPRQVLVSHSCLPVKYFSPIHASPSSTCLPISSHAAQWDGMSERVLGGERAGNQRSCKHSSGQGPALVAEGVRAQPRGGEVLLPWRRSIRRCPPPFSFATVRGSWPRSQSRALREGDDGWHCCSLSFSSDEASLGERAPPLLSSVHSKRVFFGIFGGCDDAGAWCARARTRHARRHGTAATAATHTRALRVVPWRLYGAPRIWGGNLELPSTISAQVALDTQTGRTRRRHLASPAAAAAAAASTRAAVMAAGERGRRLRRFRLRRRGCRRGW